MLHPRRLLPVWAFVLTTRRPVPQRGPVPCGTLAMGRAPSQAPAFAWKGAIWAIVAAGRSVEAKATSLGLVLHPRKYGIEPVGRVHVLLKYRYEIDDGSGEVRLAPVAETLRRYRKRHLRLCHLAAVGEIGVDAIKASEASFRSVVKLATDREGLEAEMARMFGANRCLAGLNSFARK